jgi:plastocyanin
MAGTDSGGQLLFGLVRARRLIAALLLPTSFLLAAGCQDESGGDVTPDSTAPPVVPEGEVLVKDVSFNPRELRAAVGTPVTWRFDDGGLGHTVTADDESFDSGRMTSGTYQRTFSAPGTVNYHCTVHARMRGTVLVSG